MKDVVISGGADPAAGRLRADWWIPALARHERPTDVEPTDVAPTSLAAISPLSLARPAWCGIAEQAVALADPAPGELPITDLWQESLTIPLRPFLARVEAQLIYAIERHPIRTSTNARAVARTFTAVLAANLARIAVRTLILELDTARADEMLTGETSQERFADFLRRQCTPGGLAALFEQYPVLARLLATAAGSAAEAGVELVTRLAADRPALVDTLLGAEDPGPVVAIEPGLGDPHHQGRSATLVRFADGRTVIYKPRSLEAHLRFGGVVDWLNLRIPDCDLRAAAVLARPGYGWIEFITETPLSRSTDARRFYRREGVLLAALYALHATDMHCENIIACADQPILVDVETLFHPTLPKPDLASEDPAVRALADSVHRTALLPYLTAGENGVLDLSGMGGDPGDQCPEDVLDWDPPASDRSRLIRRTIPFDGARNRPRFDGRLIEPADHEAEIVDGFRLGYDAIVRDREEFARLVESCADLEIRVVVRPSSSYARLLEESTHPDFLRDARHRDKALDVLDEASARHPLWRRLAPHERTALWAGDLPLITARAGSRDLWTCTGQRLPNLLERSGLDGALAKIAAMGEIDRGEQEWVIRASLAARRPVGEHCGGPAAASGTPTAAVPGRLLAAASALADQIVARGATRLDEGDRGRINWLGLQAVDDARWMLLPMGAGLADGYLGVALFLAQLARVTGITRYAQVARRAVCPVPRLWAALAEHPELLALVGCGSNQGLGGMSYGLTRLATLLDDEEVLGWAMTGVELATVAADLLDSADQPAAPGWAEGTAGCLAAMTAVHTETGSAAAGALAAACAEKLVDLAERTGGRCAPDGGRPRPGFAEGPAGIGWALARFNATRPDPDPRYLRAAQAALLRSGEQLVGETDRAYRAGYADSTNSVDAADPISAIDHGHGWCRGTAGLLVAYGSPAAKPAPAELRAGLRALAERPVLEDLSLCHGELGVAEALTVLAGADRSRVALRARLRRAGLVLDALQRRGPHCATPGGIPTPGLMQGLAGIGYGLLRLGFPEQVPSVLLLEPTP